MKQGDAEAYWDSRADTYDTFYRKTPIRQRLVDKVSLGLGVLPESFETALDLGSGSGRLTEAIAKNINIRQVWAVDVSSRMIDRARNRLMGTGYSDRISWIQADVVGYQPEASVDVCVSGLLMHQLEPEDKDPFLRMCYETLNPGGVLALADQMICQSDDTQWGAAARRRRSLRPRIREFFYPDGLPDSYRDAHEHTELDSDVYRRIRAAGFKDIHFYQICPIVGLFFATKCTEDTVAIRPLGRWPVVPDGLPPALADDHRVVKQKERHNGYRRTLVEHLATRERVWIEEATGQPGQANPLAAAAELHGKLSDDSRVLPLLPADPAGESLPYLTLAYREDLRDPDDQMNSVFGILRSAKALAEMLTTIHELGYIAGESALRSFMVDEQGVVITSLLGCRKFNAVADERSDVVVLGTILVESLLDHAGEPSGHPEALQEQMFDRNIPSRLASLCRALMDGKLAARAAARAIGRFTRLADQDRRTPQGVVSQNRELLDIWEHETAPEPELSEIWRQVEKDQLLRQTIEYLFQVYESAHCRSNAFAILAHHDFESLVRITNKRLEDAVLRDMTIRGCDFSDWTFERCDIKECTFEDCRFDRAAFRRSEIVRSSFQGGSLAGLRASSTRLIGTVFGGVDLRAADLRYSNLERVRVHGSKVADLNLEGANLHSATVSDCDGVGAIRLAGVNAWGHSGKELEACLKQVEHVSVNNYDKFDSEYERMFGERFAELYWWRRSDR